MNEVDEIHLKPGEIVARARSQFENHREPDQMYITFRGLRSRMFYSRKVDGYSDALPEFEGKTIIDLVNLEVEERKRQAQATGKPPTKVVIVDLGYGRGNFLLDCRQEWQDAVKLVGFGTSIPSDTPLKLWGCFQPNGLILPPTADLLTAANISRVEGNAIDIAKILGRNFADFVVSSFTLSYVNYPPWEMMKKLYRILKPNGVALVDFGISLARSYREQDEETQRISAYLAKHGYLFELKRRSTAFRRTSPDIKVPIATSDFVATFGFSRFSKLKTPAIEGEQLS